MSSNSIVVMTLGALVAVAACSKKDPAANQEPAPAAVATTTSTQANTQPVSVGPADAKKMFTSRCAVCHGESGTGDGAGAAALNPKPRNYTDAEWQKSVTDEQIKNTILLGGAAVGKSAAMPASPDLQSKPELLDALVKHVRSFSQ